MRLDLVTDDLMNIDILNIVLHADGRPLYRIQTSTKLLVPYKTSILKMEGLQGNQGREIATITWKQLSAPVLEFMGEKMKIKNFLREDKALSLSRLVTGTNGETYKWKVGSESLLEQSLELYDTRERERRVACFQYTTNPKNNKYQYLDVADREARETLDVIVISMVIMKKREGGGGRGLSGADAMLGG